MGNGHREKVKEKAPVNEYLNSRREMRTLGRGEGKEMGGIGITANRYLHSDPRKQ